MNGWKELKIDNLPEDIDLLGNPRDCKYDIQFRMSDRTWWKTNHSAWWMILKEIAIQGTKYRYRKPEPKAPTLEELQKRIDDTLAYLNCGVVHEYEIIFKLLKGKESATPPEAKK